MKINEYQAKQIMKWYGIDVPNGQAAFSPEEAARIRGPIGLKSIGGLEPAEIAVAILAELIMARRGKLAAGGKEAR